MSNRTTGTTRRSGRPTPARPGTAPADGSGSRRRALWIAIGAVILIAAVVGIAIAATSGDDGDAVADSTETGGAETIGDPLPLLTDPADDPAIGSPVPAVSAATFDGERVFLDETSGARIYGFFAHWCPHCRAELPRIVDFLESSGMPDDVDLWAISTAVDASQPNYPPSEWFDTEDYPLPVLLDSADNRLATAFGLRSYPYFVVVDDDNEVVARVSGELTAEQFSQLVLVAQQS